MPLSLTVTVAIIAGVSSSFALFGILLKALDRRLDDRIKVRLAEVVKDVSGLETQFEYSISKIMGVHNQKLDKLAQGQSELKGRFDVFFELYMKQRGLDKPA